MPRTTRLQAILSQSDQPREREASPPQATPFLKASELYTYLGGSPDVRNPGINGSRWAKLNGVEGRQAVNGEMLFLRADVDSAVVRSFARPPAKQRRHG